MAKMYKNIACGILIHSIMMSSNVHSFPYTVPRHPKHSKVTWLLMHRLVIALKTMQDRAIVPIER